MTDAPDPAPPSPAPSSPATPSAPASSTSSPAGRGPAPQPEGGLASAGVMRLATSFYGVVLLFSIGYALFSDGLSGLGALFGEKAPTLPTLLAGIGVGLVIVGVTRLGVKMWYAIEDAARVIAVTLGPLTRRQALILAALSGVGEELLFRGALWEPLGLWGTTCLFALVHFVPKRQLWGYPLFAAGAGLLFGVLRMGTESVIPAVLAHVTVNAINLMWLGSNYDELARQEAADQIARAADES